MYYLHTQKYLYLVLCTGYMGWVHFEQQFERVGVTESLRNNKFQELYFSITYSYREDT